MIEAGREERQGERSTFVFGALFFVFAMMCFVSERNAQHKVPSTKLKF